MNTLADRVEAEIRMALSQRARSITVRFREKVVTVNAELQRHNRSETIVNIHPNEDPTEAARRLADTKPIGKGLTIVNGDFRATRRLQTRATDRTSQ